MDDGGPKEGRRSFGLMMFLAKTRMDPGNRDGDIEASEDAGEGRIALN